MLCTSALARKFENCLVVVYLRYRPEFHSSGPPLLVGG